MKLKYTPTPGDLVKIVPSYYLDERDYRMDYPLLPLYRFDEDSIYLVQSIDMPVVRLLHPSTLDQIEMFVDEVVRADQ